MSKDTFNFGTCRVASLGDVDGVCKVDASSFTFVSVQEPELIKEVYSRSHQSGDCFGKNMDFFNVDFFFETFGDGLFTAADEDKWWGIAHRILIKPFSRQGLMSLVPLFVQQADLLIAKLKKESGPRKPIFLYDYTVMMAVESITVCAMGLSFGSFEKPHPFITALNEFIVDISLLFLTPSCCRGKLRKRIIKNKQIMRDTCDEVIAKRRSGESKSQSKFPDLLDAMIEGVDEQTGEKLTDDVIRFNIMTFLLAGQDSTAAAMSSFFCFLAAHPAVEAKVIAEIQDVVGDGEVEWKHLNKLKYLDWCQKETLRLVPPAPAINKKAYKETTLGGKWHIPENTLILINIFGTHLDKKVWGEDAEIFIPERWEKGAPHPFAYMPFSHGPRSCIGREFSLVEQKVTIVKLLQNFIIRRSMVGKPQKGNKVVKMTDRYPVLNPEYGMEVEYNPLQGFNGCCAPMELCERPRLTKPPSAIAQDVAAEAAQSLTRFELRDPSQASHNTPLLILYGSDGGTTVDCVEQVMHTAQELGFVPRTDTLNHFAGSSELKKPSSCVLILSATYNGLPATNAQDFVEWLVKCSANHEQVVLAQFAVYGCGHSDWANTFQAIPIFLDQKLGDVGGHRILPLYTSDSKNNPEGDFATWHNAIWPALGTTCGVKIVSSGANTGPALKIPDVSVIDGASATPVVMRFEGEQGWMQQRVLENRELLKEGAGASTRHVVIELAGGVGYNAGDHLAVQGENDPELVAGLLAHMQLPIDTVVSKGGENHLLEELLLRTVDLVKPITAQVALYLSTKAACPKQSDDLRALSQQKIQETKVTAYELLHTCTSIRLNVAELLAVLPPMKARYYSISSSPLALPTQCSLTVGVVKGISPTGREHKGLCSSFLATRSTGDKLWVRVRDMGSSFRLPPPEVPVIMVGPGTGIAPFMGFLQEMQKRHAAGEQLGAAHLFFGCQTPAKFLYEEELKAFENDGTLAGLHIAFSRFGEKKYVQKDIVQQGETLWPLLSSGGHIFVCGDASRMAPDVKKAIKDVAIVHSGLGDTQAKAFIEQLCMAQSKRYHEDVWAGTA